ncbi:MATE family efflux transporter [Sphingomicrobium lutaoense]|uniref:Putative MATE family efflux protein n=1 Tax=Sphingomicrobium lutaoense TaxID=515949 RepID=A0A839YZG8_9SPHN|nr:MATE family efflux transporter [Sphingomicrobium lutaoense]MBB3764386.1 putative MATE family efflux protein [Sphingomicrobium lutaoense]
MTSPHARLVSGSIAGHLWAQTSPMLLGVAAIMSVGIIDAYFIGQLGSAELAAVSFIFPVTVALSSLGVGLMAGTSSVVSRALGEGDHDKAWSRGNLAIALAAIAGLSFAGLLLLVRLPLFRLMQAEPELLPLIDAYMVPFAMGYPLFFLMFGINGGLRGQGAAKRSSAILIAYAAANWVLDPILITGAFGFAGFGIAGAAYATIGGWMIAATLGFFMLQSGTIPFSLNRLRGLDWGVGTKAIARVAGPAAFSNSVNPIGLAVLTALVAASGQDAVAGFGAGGRLQSFAVVPLLALSGSIGAIVGQNWGARRIDRVHRALLLAGGFCLAYGLVTAAALVWAREPLAALFSEDEAIRAEIGRYLAIAAWGYAGYGLLIMGNGALNAVDKAGAALAQSLVRVLLVMVPTGLVLRAAWGAEGVYAAELAANLAGGTIAAAMLYWLFWRHPEAIHEQS